MQHKQIQAPRFQNKSRYYRLLEEISAGDLFVGFLSSAMSTRLLYKVAHERAIERSRNKIALARLEECGYVQRKTKNGEVGFFMTQKGKFALHEIYKNASSVIKYPEKWDGMWRIVSYDFPEEKRSARNSLRHVLSKSHFLQMQKSVWIFPYESKLLSELLAENEIVRAHTIFIKAKTVSSDALYKKHFHL